MIKTTLQFTNEQNDAFRRIAKEQGRPFSQAVRGALDEWLIAKEKGKPLEEVVNTDTVGVTVWIQVDSYSDEQEYNYSNAVAEEDEHGELLVYNQKTNKVLARFDKGKIKGWTTWV